MKPFYYFLLYYFSSGLTYSAIDVHYTSGTDSDVENITTKMDNVTINTNNVDSPSRKVPTGVLLRKLCKDKKIQVNDILRYNKEEKNYYCRVLGLDKDKTPTFSFTHNNIEHNKKYSDLEPLLRWILTTFTGELAPSLKDVYDNTYLIRADQEIGSLNIIRKELKSN